MKPHQRKTLILSLIKDDLVNAKLVHGLDALGLDSGKYFLHLGSTVFQLMGFRGRLSEDGLAEHYYELCKRALYLDIEHTVSFERLAEEIYNDLLQARGRFKPNFPAYFEQILSQYEALTWDTDVVVQELRV